jgi:hypothetical protein
LISAPAPATAAARLIRPPFALVTVVGRHGEPSGTYWSGGRLGHLLKHLPYRLSALVDLRGYMSHETSDTSERLPASG